MTQNLIHRSGVGRVVSRVQSVAGTRRSLFGRDMVLVLPECVAIVACIGLIWLSLLMPLSREIEAANRAAVENTSNLARAFDENTERIVSGIDQILLTARAAYAEHKGHLDLVAWTANRVKVDKLAFFIGRVDAQGMTRESTLVPTPASINVSDREHFRAQLDPGRDELFISKPVIGRATGRPALQFTRKLLTEDGRFDGVIQVSLDSEELSRFYEKLEIGHGYIVLAGNDGVIRARGPLDPKQIGQPIGEAAMLGTVARLDQGTIVSSAPGQSGDIVSFRHLHDYPLTVLVGFDHAEIFDKYELSRRNALITGALASIGMLLLGTFWIDQRRRTVRSRRALHVTLESIDQGIVMLDAEGCVPVINERARQLLELPDNWLPRSTLDATGRATLQLPGAVSGHPTSGEHARHDGQIIEVQRNPIASGGVVLTYTDVTERRLAEAQIRHLAHHDTLTGLANRFLLSEHLASTIRTATATDGSFAVLCLDLDGFKDVNDSLGHEAGDVLLSSFAERLRRVVRPTDTVARTGGDEFTILQQGGDQPQSAEQLAIRLMEELHHPIKADCFSLRVQTSIGIASFPRDGLDSRTLLRNADTALYQAKEDGRGTYRVFEPVMDAFHQERRLLEQDLRLALAANELDLYLQPQFDCATLQITGFETLVRWKHPTRGFVPPSVFIPIAEECGLIAALGRTVLERACELASQWSPPCRIAVNVSPIQFRDGALPTLIADTLRRTGLAPHLLEVEVTEGVLIGDEQEALSSLRAIKAQGVRVALDDFGTGYSSLSYLRRFPFDKIKIDKSFVQAQQHDNGTQAIIDAVFAMSSRLRLDVTAEGVETEEQLAMLQAQRCTEVQGFLLGVPMPAHEVPALLRAGRTSGPRRRARPAWLSVAGGAAD